MGLSFSKIWERFMGKKEMRILMVGLDAAGTSRAPKISADSGVWYPWPHVGF